MHNNDLQTIKDITKRLDSLNHPDSYRIAREIYTYSNGSTSTIESVLTRLASNEPWEYVKGSAEFMGREFKVTNSTLIPRLETEELVKFALQIVTENKIKHVVDVGTGSGAIIISLAKLIINIDNSILFTATDISKEALKVAQENTKTHELGDRINFVNTNLIDGINDIKSDTLVVANLPYIPTDIYNQLHKSVKDFEPANALDGGEKGMKYITELFVQIQKLKNHPAFVLLEIDPSIKDALIDSAAENMADYSINIVKDFRELDRFAILSKITV